MPARRTVVVALPSNLEATAGPARARGGGVSR
jgi:hypothetical protein